MADRPGIVKVLRDSDLKPTEKLLLAILANYQGRNGAAWPSRATLADDLDVSERTIQRLIRALSQKGKIEVYHPDHQGRKMHNEYRIIDRKKGDASVSLFGQEGRHPCRKKGDIHVAPYKRTGSVNIEVSACEKTFVPPTVDQVRDYAATLGNSIFPAERFVEHYAGLDWHDRNGNPVKCWKGRVRTWHARENERRVEQGLPPLDGYSQYGTHKATWAEIEQLQADGVL